LSSGIDTSIRTGHRESGIARLLPGVGGASGFADHSSTA
jgi:hypothetical protein